MDINDFDYYLPKELIAQKAARPKDSSRLMVLKNDKIEHKHFYDIVDYLQKNDVLVINESKVIRAKICGKKATGGNAALILCGKVNEKDEKESRIFKARIKANKVRVGDKYIFRGGLSCEVIGQEKDIFTVRFNKPITKNIKKRFFELPAPPYVKRKLTKNSEYQTIYSRKEGSLAAPTAGLHFTRKLLRKIKKKGVKIAKVCLHIDFGTFLPVRGKVEEHKMHEEYFEIDKKNADIINSRKGRLIAVGTTSVRALESSADENGKIMPKKGETDLFIYPGYKFKTKIDALITNFHLPKSTLLMLVSAYYGREKI
ncbi:MAG: tRNA preQ1(34) S-adenosylmethionine ribosyltransferase-isomerase QueA, partial [Candidatus Woesearchaeota archaeon]|nr:tRNA preQ1(34) S-adenosylmethionine ribosyltransferase-isomerase QueA [Candidatus Woesearchaeota archaeon]